MVNEYLAQMPGSYLFTETGRRAAEWVERHPGKRLLRLGLGDVSLPIPAVAAEAMRDAAAELSSLETFRGYGPECGYDFLRYGITRAHYHDYGIEIDPGEVYVSDGAKSDCGGILDIFDKECRIALCDPVYPAYAEALAIGGRAGSYSSSNGRWENLIYLPCTAENGFVPAPPEGKVDLVYLCFPNNPTGAVASGKQLEVWVEWANRTGAVILFDGAYEAYISDETVPHSIYEIDGARNCAIEMRSFSKMAGFTGVRCAYTVIPRELIRNGRRLGELWRRRQAARFNGVSYIAQRGAEAVCSELGCKQVGACIEYYMRNAFKLRDGLRSCGLTVYGGEHAPYIWIKAPSGMKSWAFFDLLLEKGGVLATPGVGFGLCGEGYIRLTAFGSEEDTKQALERIAEIAPSDHGW